MTRIIAGEWGGRRITVPPQGTRPTTDRVREAIFSKLDHAGALRDARVLDLYAGSGALGLEALSRGAAHATFVEASAKAVGVIKANARELGAGLRVTIVTDKATPFLARSTQTWNVVLIDPPYALPPADLAAMLHALAPRLEPGATVVLEWSSRAGAPEWPEGVVPQEAKVYGETTVHYATAAAPHGVDDADTGE